MTERAMEREGGQSGVEVDKKGHIMAFPCESGIAVDGESVDLVQGSEVAEVRL